MPTSTAYTRAAERVVRICGAHHDDARALRVALLDEIRRVVGFDAYAWLLTDPETEVGCDPLAAVPCLPELPNLIRLKYLTSVNRWTELDRSASLRTATADQPDRSLVWRELLVRHGVTDVASMVFRDKFGCWAFLDLWRMDPESPFTNAEGDFLRSILGNVTEALRRCQAATFSPTTPGPLRTGPVWTGPVVLVLSPALDVLGQTPETEQYLEVLVPPEVHRRAIPAAAYNVGAQLIAVECGVDHHAPSARVHLAGGTWVTLRAARIGKSSPTEPGDIAVTIEFTLPSERSTLFARACGLTAREAELLGFLVTGSDTRQIAERMFLSEHTVQDHLKSIFAKTATRNRRQLVACAVGG